MTATELKIVVDGKHAKNNSSFVQSFMARANTFFKKAFSKRGRTSIAADKHIMKNLNGLECTYNQHGFITELKDNEGRAWTFSYIKERVVSYSDPQGRKFLLQVDVFVETTGKSVEPAPRFVSVDHENGQVTVIDSVRKTTYKPDGSTVIVAEQERDGQLVRVCFTEYPTRPHRAFVVIEERAGKQMLTWTQDANAKLFKFEYDADGQLIRYTDVSGNPATVWTVAAMSNGQATAWRGVQKSDGAEIGAMIPLLESVDLCGNRHFKRPDGTKFVVGPSGDACLETHLSEEFRTGKSPVVTFPVYPAYSPESGH